MKSKIIVSVLLLGLQINISTISYARQMSSGDIVGRELSLPGAGWAGHVGMATGDNVGQVTSTIIEALWETPVIQINSAAFLKKEAHIGVVGLVSEIIT